MLSNRGIFLIILLLVIFTRFFKLNWGNDFFFNPDENNMADSILRINQNNFDPHFYAYGQFPLYLSFFTTPKHDFKNIILTLRFWSAFFSSLSLYFFYLIGLKIFKSKKNATIFLLFLIFTPGLIQISHFGTTESILLLAFTINIYLSFKIYDTQKTKYLIVASIISGIGLATKISSLILITPVFLSILFLFIRKSKFWKLLLWNSILFLSLTIFIGIIFSPYNLINFTEFHSALKYEIGVATGQIPVFYTRQFINSPSYIFQFQKIFPYVNGLTIFILGLIGFCFIFKSYINNHKLNTYLLLTLFPCLIYFIYQGQLFTKWTRFMSSIFFVFPLLSIFIIQKIQSKILLCLIIFISILPGIYFMKIYFFPDIRVIATDWINKNVPTSGQILSETGNVVDIPLSGQISVKNFDFYTLDDDITNKKTLNQLINQSNYILVPSRRIFKNQNNTNFPYSQKYYQNLFSGRLNFSLIKIISNNNSLFMESENAEETWSVFDNPVIRIYKKKNDTINQKKYYE